MPTTVVLGAALIAIAVGTGVWLLVTGTDPVRKRSVANLNRRSAAAQADPWDGLFDEPEERGALARLARRVTPGPLVRLLEKLHARAGRPASWPVDRLLVIKMLWLTANLWADFVLITNVSSQSTFVMALAFGTVMTYFSPELMLWSRAQERSQQIQLELADTLDQMTIAVEAGLGFDAAMARVGANGRGALAEELARTLQDIQMGLSRRRAYEALAQRTDVVDLRRFIRAVLQADTYGISIADVLRTQAAEMRKKRRQRAEQKAQQIPVKVLFPLMTCILPVLFIVVMGPAAMDIVQMFSSM